MHKPILFILFTILCVNSITAQHKTENVFLIMTDGLRWQEIFRGADSALINDVVFTPSPEDVKPQFWKETTQQRREVLFPFLWTTIGKQGQLYGNRHYGNKVNVKNPFWFSYPGYSETLTGFVDTRINSNDKVLNPNQTVLEFINQQKGFTGKVAAYTTWDVFPFIINESRSRIPVNSGYEQATGQLSVQEELLNDMQKQVPSPWGTTRLDWMTYYLAKEYIKKNKPRVFFLSFDETDDYAHAGKYDTYLKTAHMVDGFIGDLWNFVQSQPQYKDKTTFIITTDHGRGDEPKALWKDHGDKVVHADQIWMAVIGPDTPNQGEMKVEGQYYQNQIAKTLAAFLGITYTNTQPVGEIISPASKAK
ncbi:phosphoglyceromutase [Xanthocytophaga agilis]|uniref:Phosphoglyceromutase n=1 Tax=Xanthocytophaga agilis TaxID=3048010 RepID=A0AAE3R875_9BACT|nr:phosphoglyceromutase [Xanthocytophaga agilis]MDJ1502553.1 phosphoglyceromutase [Xanthocytophaga agilis]